MIKKLSLYSISFNQSSPIHRNQITSREWFLIFLLLNRCRSQYFSVNLYVNILLLKYWAIYYSFIMNWLIWIHFSRLSINYNQYRYLPHFSTQFFSWNSMNMIKTYRIRSYEDIFLRMFYGQLKKTKFICNI